jgi:hypothetical protein
MRFGGFGQCYTRAVRQWQMQTAAASDSSGGAPWSGRGWPTPEGTPAACWRGRSAGCLLDSRRRYSTTSSPRGLRRRRRLRAWLHCEGGAGILDVNGLFQCDVGGFVAGDGLIHAFVDVADAFREAHRGRVLQGAGVEKPPLAAACFHHGEPVPSSDGSMPRTMPS